MKFGQVCIPLGFAWSSPFARWQGPLAEISSLDLAVDVTARALRERGYDPTGLGRLVLGWTVPQPHSFYGAPTVATRLGAPRITGPMISQACATSVACLEVAAASIELGEALDTLVLTTDRTSNGPLLIYPRPTAPGGAPASERWVLDSFNCDPCTDESMLDTAEHLVEEVGISRQELDDLTLLRYEQYRQALAVDRAFQRRYLVPVEIPSRRGEPTVVETDVGIHPTTAEGLARLQPVRPNGTITYGTQTHPADGTAGLLVTTETRARDLSTDGIARLLATGVARVEPARMPKAPVSAALAALDTAGISLRQVNAVVTHNPFAANDVWFSRQTGYPLEGMNLYGCSLIYGHPQGPTGARGIAELIETLRTRGGGIGLFTGCAAGDTGAAVVLRVED
jgi:acetyl-CoA acetyltransferase family protein